MKCRHCSADLRLPFVDLGSAPPSNAYLSETQLHEPEKWYPLRVMVCEACWLVQTEDYAGADELFNQDYAYFSSVSSSWLDHSRRYVESMTARFKLGAQSLVTEIAANDGYLLQYVRQLGIPCYGIEPTASTAAAARQKNIPIIEKFFGLKLANELAGSDRRADLIVCNNVLAHVPDINDFLAGIAVLLKSTGVATFEFPSLLNLVRHNQFDTIYHEHFSYLSLMSVDRIFRAHGLCIVDAEQLSTHGGSLRVFAARTGAFESTSSVVGSMLAEEAKAGVGSADFYMGFQSRVDAIKDALLDFLLEQKKAGRRIAAYGAAAKGNTLLNYAGIRSDLLPYVVDRSPGKLGKYLPGSRIRVVDEARLYADKPEWVLILPWNLRAEIECQLQGIKDWGGKFVWAVPQMEFA